MTPNEQEQRSDGRRQLGCGGVFLVAGLLLILLGASGEYVLPRSSGLAYLFLGVLLALPGVALAVSAVRQLRAKPPRSDS